jgi:hypothetical protein
MVFFPNSRSWKGSDKWRQNIKSNQYCIKISKTPKKIPKLLLKKRRNLSKKKITNQCPGNTTSTLLYVCWYWMTDLQSRMWSHALLHYSCISLWRIRYKVQKRVQTSPNCYIVFESCMHRKEFRLLAHIYLIQNFPSISMGSPKMPRWMIVSCSGQNE